MPTPTLPWLLTIPLVTLAGCASRGVSAPPPDDTRAAVNTRLDTLHAAASRADASTYWSCFAPSAVFIGTDATERWTLPEFRAYADPLFDQGKGWTYSVLERHIVIGDEPTAPPRFAWFDERLTNAKYGECRGSGVLTRADHGPWLVEQYNLAVPVPNDLLPDVAGRIRGYLEHRSPLTPAPPARQ